MITIAAALIVNCVVVITNALENPFFDDLDPDQILSSKMDLDPDQIQFIYKRSRS